MSQFPEPIVTPMNREFWAGLEAGRFLIQRCESCGAYNYPPRPACPTCNSSLAYEEADGTGTIYTYGVVHRPNVPDVFESDVPFLLAVVELDEGPRVVTKLADADPDDVTIGDPVEIEPMELDVGVSVLNARLLTADTGERPQR